MKYGCIAKSLSHSYSPEIHALIGSYEYEMKELSDKELARFMAERDFLAVNVTIPYKEAVLPYLDFISENAEKIGAVNTVVNREGKLFGYNTDYPALLELILRTGVSVEGKKVLILGTGGTSRTAAAVMRELMAGEVITVSRSGRCGAVTYEEAYLKHTDAEVIVNATPVGMYPDVFKRPIDISPFTSLSLVVDAIYNPLRTRLICDAMERGIKCTGGLYMLAAQAVAAAKLFPFAPVNTTDAAFVERAVARDKENIVLIGMPSVGKTVTGKLIAKALGRQFLDTDTLVFKKFGKTPAELITELGEVRLRECERSVLTDIASVTGAVIATGGGILSSEGARACLSMIGRLYFIDKHPDSLAVGGDRPLSSSREQLYALYERRLPVYAASADERIGADGYTNEQIADIIIGLHNR